MAVNEFTQASNKKVSANGNWSLGHKPLASEDVVFPEGKEPEINAIMVCRSLLARKNVVFSGSSKVEIGNSEKPEGPAGAGVILDQESGVIWPNGLSIRVASTYTASELTIKISPSWLSKEAGFLTIQGTATYGFAEDAKIDATLILGGSSSTPTINTASHALSVGNKSGLPNYSGQIEFSGGATFSLGSSIVTTGEWFADGGTTTINAGTSTIVIADGVRGFFEGTRTYHSLSLEGGRPQLVSNFTLEGTLSFNRTNGFAGIGFTLFAKPLGGSEEGESIGNGKFTVTLKKGAGVATNGTAEHPAEVVGTSEAERSQLVLEEDIEVKGVLNWKYIEAVNHTIYAPEAASITGCKNIVKEAKPGGGVTIALNSASGASSAALAALAATVVSVAAAGGQSAGSLAVVVLTTVPLAAAASSSIASVSASAQTTVPLASAVSVSSGVVSVSARTLAELTVASSSSTASATLSAITIVTLQSATSASSAVATVTVPSGATIPLVAASSSSAGTASVAATTQVALSAAQAVSNATNIAPMTRVTVGLAPAAAVSTAAGTLQTQSAVLLNPASSTSTGSCTVTITVAGELGTVALSDEAATTVALDVRSPSVALSDAASTFVALGDSPK